MTGALVGGGGGSDATLYLGLAAAAFLLVLLYPDGGAPTPAEAPITGASLGGANTGGASLGAAKRAADLVQLQQQQQAAAAEAGDNNGARAPPGVPSALLAHREPSSASLNLWLGAERHSEPRPAPGDAVYVRPVTACTLLFIYGSSTASGSCQPLHSSSSCQISLTNSLWPGSPQLAPEPQLPVWAKFFIVQQAML